MLSEFIGWPSQHSCMNIQSASPALQEVIDVSCFYRCLYIASLYVCLSVSVLVTLVCCTKMAERVV